MNAERYQRICDLFVAACELDHADRRRVLDDADPELRAEVEQLLCDDAAAALLDPQAAGDGTHRQLLEDLAAAAAGETPQRIGRYRIVRKIAEGGMGTVYEAEPEGAAETVALKVIRGGVASPEMLRRFESEKRVLALLDHPGIARIHEAGTTITSFGVQPYFVMELVRGRPILAHARERALTVEDRLELVARVCDAVHHAHQKGVIHRDLKPGNILVVDGPGGQPKILDFGVARAIDSDLRATAVHTGVGQIVGTVPYMSPEQAGGDPGAIDTRSDVYALGVLTYELLTFQLPYDLKGRMVHDALRIIREGRPRPLGAIDPRLRGDVETIVAKALENQPARRYDSAAALGADIRRFLADEPILARPAPPLEQLARFARRNRLMSGAVLAVALALLLGATGTVIGLVRARVRHDQAIAATQRMQQMRDEAEAVTAFLERMLEAADPEQFGPDVRVRTLLELTQRSIDTELSGRPLVEARLRHTLGSTYLTLGDLAAAESHLAAALEIRRDLLGLEHPETLLTRQRWGRLLNAQGRYADSQPLHEALWESCRSALGETHETTLAVLCGLGDAQVGRGDYQAAEASYRQVHAARLAMLGPDHPDSIDVRRKLGVLCARQGRSEEAEAILLELLETVAGSHGEADPARLGLMSNLASLYWTQGRYEDMIPVARETIALQQQALGQEHPRTLITMSNLAVAYLELGRFDEARSLHETVLEIRQRRLGDEHPDTLSTVHNLAVLLRRQGRLAEAEPLFERVLEARRRTLVPDHDMTLKSMISLGMLRWRMGRYDDAEPLLTTALESARARLGPDHPRTLDAQHGVALLARARGRLGEAEDLLRRTLAARRILLAEDHPETLNVAADLAGVLADAGRHDEAEALLVEVLEGRGRRLGPGHPETLESLQALIDLYEATGRPEAARRLRERGP